MVNFLFALIELSSLSITVPELWGKFVQLSCFRTGGLPLCTQIILLGQGRPHKPFYVSEN